MFNKIGNQTEMFSRFSTVGGEKGSADTERDARGFSMKFYLCHFFRANENLGRAVAKVLEVDVEEVLRALKHELVEM